jgi:hypothetical protein
VGATSNSKPEGQSSYQGRQTFLEVTSRIAGERRVSRFLYVAEKV